MKLLEKYTCSEIPHVFVSDILPDILIRLPLKPLIRFCLVCKRWDTLITKDSRFRNSIISNQKPTVTGLLILSRYCNQHHSLDYIPFHVSQSKRLSRLDSVKEELYSLNPLQTCNGLLLCSDYRYEQGRCNKYYVFNRTTRKTLPLPEEPPDEFEVWPQVIGMSLAFDPAKSPYYDVVGVLKSGTHPHHVSRIFIYSSKTGAWRVSSAPPFLEESYYKEVNFDDGVYWNGGIHWISCRYVNPVHMLYFNIENEVIKTMPSVPITGHTKNGDRYFGESCGHLLFVESGFEELQIYEMKRDYSEWCIKHIVNLLQINMVKDDYPKVKIISVVCGDEEDDSCLVLRVPGKIMLCDLASSTCQKLRDIDDALHISIFHCIESLCPVRCLL